MIRRRIAAVLAAFLLGAAAGAAAQSFKPFVVKDIRAEGLQRTEPGTVFSYLPVKVGETMNEEKAQQALRALYATGFFTDRKSTRLNSSHGYISYAVFCLKKKKKR